MWPDYNGPATAKENAKKSGIELLRLIPAMPARRQQYAQLAGQGQMPESWVGQQQRAGPVVVLEPNTGNLCLSLSLSSLSIYTERESASASARARARERERERERARESARASERASEREREREREQACFCS